MTARDVGVLEKGAEIRRDAAVMPSVLGVDRTHVETHSRLGIDFKIERDDAQRPRFLGNDGTGIGIRARQNESHGKEKRKRFPDIVAEGQNGQKLGNIAAESAELCSSRDAGDEVRVRLFSDTHSGEFSTFDRADKAGRPQ